MKEIFREEWLKEIPLLGDFWIPRGYNHNHFVSWEKKFEFDEKNLISTDGRFGKVYDVGEDLVAKVSRQGPFIRKGMAFNTSCVRNGSPYFTEREFWMNKKLREIQDRVPNPEGRVPIPKGLFLVHNKFLDEYRPAFVMEKINHVEYERNAEERKVDSMISEGLAFFRSEGIDVGNVDSNWAKNNLLSKDDGHIYHIDYMFWGIK